MPTAKDLKSGLMAAAKLGDEELARDCLEALGLETPKVLGEALSAAAAAGRLNIIALLLARGALQEDGCCGRGNGREEGCREVASSGGELALHAALRRGRVRSAFALLAAGADPTAADSAGNSALHHAAACTAGPPELRAMLLRAVLAAGADPDSQNFAGARALDLLPRSAEAREARALLSLAAAATRCAATGAPFGPQQLRYLCHSSGAFFSEEASAEVTVRMALPEGGAREDREDVSDVDGGGGTSGRRRRRDNGRGLGGHGLAAKARASDRDSRLQRRILFVPARFGSDLVFTVADAEAALEAALNPFAAATAAATAARSGAEALRRNLALSSGASSHEFHRGSSSFALRQGALPVPECTSESSPMRAATDAVVLVSTAAASRNAPPFMFEADDGDGGCEVGGGGGGGCEGHNSKRFDGPPANAAAFHEPQLLSAPIGAEAHQMLDILRGIDVIAEEDEEDVENDDEGGSSSDSSQAASANSVQPAAARLRHHASARSRPRAQAAAATATAEDSGPPDEPLPQPPSQQQRSALPNAQVTCGRLSVEAMEALAAMAPKKSDLGALDTHMTPEKGPGGCDDYSGSSDSSSCSLCSTLSDGSSRLIGNMTGRYPPHSPPLVAPASATVAVPSIGSLAEREPALFMSQKQLDALSAAADAVKTLRGDIDLLRRYSTFCARLSAAKTVCAATDEACNAAKGTGEGNFSAALTRAHLDTLLADARHAGVDATLLSEGALTSALLDVRAKLAASTSQAASTLAQEGSVTDQATRDGGSITCAVLIAASDLETVTNAAQDIDERAAVAAAAQADNGYVFATLVDTLAPALARDDNRGDGKDEQALALVPEPLDDDTPAESAAAIVANRVPWLRLHLPRLEPSALIIARALAAQLRALHGLRESVLEAAAARSCVTAAPASPAGAAELLAYFTPTLNGAEAESISAALAAHANAEMMAATESAAAAAAAAAAAKRGRKMPPPTINIMAAPSRPCLPPTSHPVDWAGVPLPATAFLSALLTLAPAQTKLTAAIALARQEGVSDDTPALAAAVADEASGAAMLLAGLDAERDAATKARQAVAAEAATSASAEAAAADAIVAASPGAAKMRVTAAVSNSATKGSVRKKRI